MKILITGGKGFVGGYLTKMMGDQGHHVFALGKDDLDVTVPSDFHVFKGLGFDAVVHLAALLMINNHKPEDYFRVNAMGTFNVLEFCRTEKIPTLVYTMTHSDVNGHTVEYGLREYDLQDFKTGSWEHNSIPFISSKIAAADMVEAYSRMNVLNGSILRLANIRGYGSVDTKYNCVFHQFIQKAMKGEDIEIWGNPPSTKRDMIYVKDVCGAIIAAVAKRNCRGYFNIGSGTGMTILQEAKEIIQVFGKKVAPCPDGPWSLVSNIVLRPDIPEVRKIGCIFNIRKALTNLGWSPKYSYLEGLEDYKGEMERANA